MADALKRLFGPAQLTTSDALQYTAPATGAVIRDIWISNPGTADDTIFMSIGSDTAAHRFFDGFTIRAGAIFHEGVNIVLGNAETIRAHAGATTVIVPVVSGVELA